MTGIAAHLANPHSNNGDVGHPHLFRGSDLGHPPEIALFGAEDFRVGVDTGVPQPDNNLF